MHYQAFDKRFLNNLKQKLNTSNRRSIYLNAIPKRYLTRLDLADLNNIEKNLADKFINQLLSNANFQFTISLNQNPANEVGQQKQDLVLRRLNSMVIENDDHYAEHGTKTFGFGYPIILRRDKKDPSRIIKAPLIVWSLDIERNFRKENQWVIKKSEDFSVTSNLVLATHLFNDNKTKLVPLYDQLLEDDILDKQELAHLAFLQMQQLSPNLAERTEELFHKVLNASPQSLKSDEEIEQLELKTPVILWSGVFGLFRSQKESIVKDVTDFENQFDQIKDYYTQQAQAKQNNPKAFPHFMKHTFSLVDTDPSQQHLLHALGRGEDLIIQGPPGTGKSRTLSSIITNAISNGGRCLVVCEKKSALDVLYNNLQKLGLDELAVIIEDVYRDRSAVINSVRDRTQQARDPNYKPSANFIRLLQNTAMQVGRLQAFHKKLMEPVCADMNWSMVVAQLLEASKSYKPSVLGQHLNPRSFNFSTEEYLNITNILKEGKPLFDKLGSLSHPLNALNERFFKIANVSQTEEEFKKILDKIAYAVEAAQRDILTNLFEYEKQIEDHYSSVFAAKNRLVDEMTEIIELGFKKNKYYFNKTGGFYRGMLGSMSSKYKELDEAKDKVLKKYFGLQQLHTKFGYFKHTFFNISSPDNVIFEDLLENIERYQSEVFAWYDDRTISIQTYVNQLSEQRVHPHTNFSKQTRDIVRNLDAFERNFAQSQLFKVQFKFSSSVIRKRLTQLEQLDENIKKLLQDLQEFKDYHALKFFWVNLNPQQQAAFHALTTANPSDWEKAFSSWYLHWMLSSKEDENVPDQDSHGSVVKTFKRDYVKLQKMLTEHTLQYWRTKQTQAIRDFHQKKAPLKLLGLYNKRGNVGGRQTPLRKIIETDSQLFSTFFPVLLVSPSVCSAILPLQPDLFDVVIFDEASQLRLEDSFPALIRGQHKVVSGDSQQMPPTDYFNENKSTNSSHQDYLIDDEQMTDSDVINETIAYLSSSESLLEYTQAEGSFQEEYLQVHYRSRHPYLIDFSNAAFYGNRLTPMPPAQDYTPIEFIQVDGLYQDHVNKKEAAQVIQLLLGIADSHGDQPCPSVGVATFNLHQRNLILEELQNKTITDPAAGDKLQKLLSHGLFVKNLENIQGDERDIIIISTTFGPDENGIFQQKFGSLNKDRGYRLLNVIITRAKYKVCMLTSIPSQNFLQYRNEIDKKGNTGKGVLYAYLAYAQAISNGDHSTRSSILELLYSNCDNKPLMTLSRSWHENLFERQVLEDLKQHIPSGRLEENFEYAGFRIPAVIKSPEGKPKVAIYFDVFHVHASEEAYAWDLFIEKHLEALGIKCVRVWSRNWWRDSTKERRRVLNEINLATTIY
ncbi:MAG: DNA helicase [Aureispira sp.]|nr:DNA helicase [Aureispira sp.]